MKTAFYFICTCFISTGIYYSALNSKNPAPCIFIAMGIWTWFFWRCDRRRKKTMSRQEREQLLNYLLKQTHRLN
jgi:hypothetical protein